MKELELLRIAKKHLTKKLSITLTKFKTWKSKTED